jgi:nitrite reductase/ring-hydroxylating ferredoxin subunit
VVNDNCVQCPFHGWLYDGRTGQCVGKLSFIQIMTVRQFNYRLWSTMRGCILKEES